MWYIKRGQIKISKEVQQLKDDIKKLSGKLEKTGTADEIRGFWQKVTNWFHRESGETQEIPEKSELNEK